MEAPRGEPSMDEKPNRSESEKPVPNAAAEWLFHDDPAPAAKPPRPAAAPDGEDFALEESPAPARRPPVPPPVWEDEPSDEPRESRPRPAPIRHLDSASAVDYPWTRWAEWGSMIAALAGWTLVAWTVVYFLLVAELYGAAVLVFGIGTIVGLALFYPIVITLERPTRMTPEQALRDYFQALSHHVPHHRRMWLLLSNAGRTSSKYASYEGFKRYWRARLARLREKGKASGFTPLSFAIVDFKSERSGGKVAIDATWTIQVFVRGRREEGPIATFPSRGSFAKGPDHMWYIDDGLLEDHPAGDPERTAG